MQRSHYFNLIEGFEQVAESPHLYPAVDDLRQGYRRAVCGIDSIYYRITNGDVKIMRILGQQDLEEWL